MLRDKFKNSPAYKAMEKEIIDIVGQEDWDRYKKEKRNERIRKYAVAAGLSVAAVAAAFAAGVVSAGATELAKKNEETPIEN